MGNISNGGISGDKYPNNPSNLKEKRNYILKKISHILHKGNRFDPYQFIDRHKMTFRVRWLLRWMGICPNAYYNYRKVGYRKQKEQ